MGWDIERGCRPNTKARTELVTISSGKFPRCPKAWLREDGAEATQFFSDYLWMRRYRETPNAGGKLDQTARFVHAVDVIEAEMFAIEEAARNGDK